MIWTKRKPTKAGWWWWRYTNPTGRPIAVEIENYGGLLHEPFLMMLLNGRWMLLADDGEWSSEPIQEPKEADRG